MSFRLIIAIFLIHGTNFAVADGVVTHLYKVKIELTFNQSVTGYFTDVDFPPIRSFKTENELKDFLVENTKNKIGKLVLYKKPFRILDYQCVDTWLRGHFIFRQREQLIIEEKSIKHVKLIEAKRIPSLIFNNLKESEIELLGQEPSEILNLELEDEILAIGDIYRIFTLISYCRSESINLKNIRNEIESIYFKEIENCTDMQKFKIWDNIFERYKEKLKYEDILFLEITAF